MFEPAKYRKEELTIDVFRANLYAVVATLPISIFACILYYLIWSEKFSREYIAAAASYYKPLMGYISIGVFVALILGAVIHELIHGLTWSLFARTGFKSIRFGIIWKAMTPYCHCSEPLRVREYVIGGAMPGIILGILPLVFGIGTGNFFVFTFGLLFAMAAGGDLLIINMLRKESGHSFVQDHPSKIGCFIFRPL